MTENGYEIDVKENSTKYLRNSRDDAAFEVNSGIQGMILETTDGAKYGMRHMDEMWLQVYEVAFSREAGLTGKTVNRITYIMSDGAYVCIQQLQSRSSRCKRKSNSKSSRNNGDHDKMRKL